MNKWGVRLISVYLFIWAISDFYELIAGNEKAVGFLGFDLGLAHNGNPIDVMGWIEVMVFVYAGIQLVRLKPSGRNWALFIFGLASLGSGIGLVLMIAILINSLVTGVSFPLTINIPWLDATSGSILYVLLLAGVLIFIYFIPVYYLMRKDVKQLFEKTDTPKETAPISDATPS